MDTISYVLAMEEISKHDSACAVVMSVVQLAVELGSRNLRNRGAERKIFKTAGPWRKNRSFPAFRARKLGSDATSQRTTAEDKGDYYLVNGTKIGSPMQIQLQLI